MEYTSENTPKKHICVGLLAKVDAGKTTLSEGLLYEGGSIRKHGRVDKKDTFLDNNSLEKERGITIFSKQAMIETKDAIITLVDTPGHMDFSPEMERALAVLDYGILVVSAKDGFDGQTRMLYKLLQQYHIPTFIFVNKIDQDGFDKEQIKEEISRHTNGTGIEYITEKQSFDLESVALLREELLETFLEQKEIPNDIIKDLIATREMIPCYFGAAIKLQNVRELLEGIETYTKHLGSNIDIDTDVDSGIEEPFSGIVYKISRDTQGNRLTYIKIESGQLRTKQLIETRNSKNGDSNENGVEKINQIRLYSGEKYETVEKADAGLICAVTGLNETYPLQGLGTKIEDINPNIEPVLTYSVKSLEEMDGVLLLQKLRFFEEEEPSLKIDYKEETKEINVRVMGQVQIEILERFMADRFDIHLVFENPRVLYRETISEASYGIGHYEPLKHYAEAHVLLKPLPRGTGMHFSVNCGENVEKSVTNLILTHCMEKEHIGALSGFPITDIEIEVVAAKAHLKHTEGGDFRQATYRAIRHALRLAEPVLLEPFYQFLLEIPKDCVGNAMVDLDRRHASYALVKTEHNMSVLEGRAPVVTIGDYARHVAAYTKGQGKLFLDKAGYDLCHNLEDVIEEYHYNPDEDLKNDGGSVFCEKGAGFYVPYYDVEKYAHLMPVLTREKEKNEEENTLFYQKSYENYDRESMGLDEIEAILKQAGGGNKKDKGDEVRNYQYKRKHTTTDSSTYAMNTSAHQRSEKSQKEKYLLVDGYNVIFARTELKQLASDNMDGARDKLIDILSNYRGMTNQNIVVVFDAYKNKGGSVHVETYKNIEVVYTKEAQTADMYIERFAHDNKKSYEITVVTSDGLEQLIIRGQGSHLLSVSEFFAHMESTGKQLMEQYSVKE